MRRGVRVLFATALPAQREDQTRVHECVARVRRRSYDPLLRAARARRRAQTGTGDASVNYDYVDTLCLYPRCFYL